MSRTSSLATATLLVTALATPAFADSGFTASNTDSGGSYHAMPGGKTREEVKAELAAAIKDGSMAKMRRNQSYVPGYEAITHPVTSAQASAKETQLAGKEAITFVAPAAGGKTRAEVLQELEQARKDGSLRRMNTNRGY